jgi:hypothetical protein
MSLNVKDLREKGHAAQHLDCYLIVASIWGSAIIICLVIWGTR